jgi:hypothetical protein
MNRKDRNRKYESCDSNATLKQLCGIRQQELKDKRVMVGELHFMTYVTLLSNSAALQSIHLLKSSCVIVKNCFY